MIKRYKVGIVGLGYVGGPLAYLVAYNGYKVIGIDKCKTAIERINKRLNVPRQLTNNYNKIDLLATEDYSLLSNSDIIIICVPTPIKNDKPDLRIFKDVIKRIKSFIKKESTVAPGMTKKYVEQYLEKYGIKLGQHYELAYCPERIDPENKKYWVGNINRVCGASSKEALKKTYEFYKSIIKAEIVIMDSIEEAELVKVWENSIRNISIAQSNLLAQICDNYNFSIKKVNEGLESKIKQFGNGIAYPGLGPGGHCIPKDIHYLIDTLNKKINIDTSILKDAVKINENMPQYAFNKLINVINNNEDDIENINILMLGKSYKPNSKDIRHSQAIALYNKIINVNKNNNIFDPIVDDNIKEKTLITLDKKLKKAEVVVLGCPHDMFLNIDYAKYKNIKYILDCWNKLDKEKIINMGINYIGVGT